MHQNSHTTLNTEGRPLQQKNCQIRIGYLKRFFQNLLEQEAVL